MTDRKRLDKIAGILEEIHDRGLSGDGPINRIVDEITQEEIMKIYRLATEGE